MIERTRFGERGHVNEAATERRPPRTTGDSVRGGAPAPPRIGKVSFLALMVSLSIAVACSRQSPAAQAAARFVDTYYVKIDPSGALELSTGQAQEKLVKELQRLAGLGPVDASDRPQIRAALRNHSVEDNGAVFTYEIQSVGDGVSELTVNVYLEERGGRWLVNDFRESEHG